LTGRWTPLSFAGVLAVITAAFVHGEGTTTTGWFSVRRFLDRPLFWPARWLLAVVAVAPSDRTARRTILPVAKMLHWKRSVRPSSLPSTLRLFALYRTEFTTKGIRFDNCGGQFLTAIGSIGRCFVIFCHGKLRRTRVVALLFCCRLIIIVAYSKVCRDVVEKVVMDHSWFTMELPPPTTTLFFSSTFLDKDRQLPADTSHAWGALVDSTYGLGQPANSKAKAATFKVSN
jgi:hypothetical protein